MGKSWLYQEVFELTVSAVVSSCITQAYFPEPMFSSVKIPTSQDRGKDFEKSTWKLPSTLPGI